MIKDVLAMLWDCIKQQKEKIFFAKKAGCSEENSPKVGMLLLVIELIPLELISMSPQGIVYDHMDGEV